MKAEKQDSVIIITSECDSLMLLVDSLYYEIEHLRSENKALNKMKEKPPSWWTRVKNNLFYYVLGGLTVAIIVIAKEIWQKVKKKKQV